MTELLDKTYILMVNLLLLTFNITKWESTLSANIITLKKNIKDEVKIAWNQNFWKQIIKFGLKKLGTFNDFFLVTTKLRVSNILNDAFNLQNGNFECGFTTYNCCHPCLECY